MYSCRLPGFLPRASDGTDKAKCTVLACLKGFRKRSVTSNRRTPFVIHFLGRFSGCLMRLEDRNVTNRRALGRMPISTDVIRAIRSYRPQSVIAKRLRPAAVLVPVGETLQGDCVTLIERAATLRTHSGEIAFPGGSVASFDKGALAAALRESQEEIGIDPANVQIIGQLDQVPVAARYLVTPFVGILSPPFSARPNEDEVRSVISIPVSALLNPNCFTAELVEAAGKSRVIYHFRYEDLDIWGATARILKQLLEVAYGFRSNA